MDSTLRKQESKARPHAAHSRVLVRLVGAPLPPVSFTIYLQQTLRLDLRHICSWCLLVVASKSRAGLLAGRVGTSRPEVAEQTRAESVWVTRALQEGPAAAVTAATVAVLPPSERTFDNLAIEDLSLLQDHIGSHEAVSGCCSCACAGHDPGAATDSCTGC